MARAVTYVGSITLIVVFMMYTSPVGLDSCCIIQPLLNQARFYLKKCRFHFYRLVLLILLLERQVVEFWNRD